MTIFPWGRHRWDETNYDEWNAKVYNILFRAISNDAFNHVRSHKDVHELWDKLVKMHERSKDKHAYDVHSSKCMSCYPCEKGYQNT